MEKKTRQPKQKRAIENKALLVEAAKKLFTEKGYLNTSSNEIVKEAGVSVGTFYAYYKDKKELFMEIKDDYNEEYIKTLEEALSSIEVHNIREYIKEIILATMDVSRKYYVFQDEFFALRHNDEDIKLQNETIHKRITLKLKEMLIRINAKNENLDITAFLLFCLVDGFSDSIIHQTDIDIDDSVKQCVEMIFKYIKLD